METFIKLKTEYSITRGTISVKEAVSLAKSYGFASVLIADDFNMFASLDFSTECIKNKIFPIIGVTIRLKFHNNVCNITTIAKTREGYENMLFLTSNATLNSKGVIEFEDFVKHSSNIIVFSQIPNESLLFELLKYIKSEDLYIEIVRLSNESSEVETENSALFLAQKLNLQIIASNDAYFQNQDMFEAADVLRCIGEGRFLTEENREKLSYNNYFKTKKEFEDLFSDLPEAIENANNLRYKISFVPLNSKPLLPSFSNDEKTLMKELAIKGLNQRIENGEVIGIQSQTHTFKVEDYFQRLEYEVEVISKMGFCGYFLIVADFIRWSKENNISVGPGRGSGAGSIVAYALRITDIDPLYYGLLFERFLNPERVSMPDFDVDFCPEGRDKVINYVKEKYGKESVAGIITFGRLQARAVLKDVGRVIQIPYVVTDKICKMIPFNPVEPVTLNRAIELDPELQKKREEDGELKRLIDLGLKLEGLIRHCSTHAAGIIIADRPLVKIAPLFKAEGDDLPSVGYHMKAAENAGLVKFDFLGLKTLTIISNTCKLILGKRGVNVDISKIPINDEKTFILLQKGLTLGIFQLESLVCRDAMRKMQIDKLEDIIALTSLNRPGPMENIPSYINRKLGKEAILYPHPILEDLLKETYGIIIYQEQVIKIAQILAGYTLGEADLLRRAMGKKLPEEMEAQRKIFIAGAVKNGVNEEKASEIFNLVEKFAGYGFNKSHAAAYSLLSYQTAYLKAHFPIEFLTANLNISISDTDELSFFVNEAKQMGIEVTLPSINFSNTLFETDGSKIIYGLSALKSVGQNSMEEMIEIRNKGGLFLNIFDFCKRVGNKIANKKQIEALVKAGAFDCLNINRKQILLSVDILTAYAGESAKSIEEDTLFASNDGAAAYFPKLKQVDADFTAEENLTNEFSAIGFYLSIHPLLRFKESLKRFNFITYAELEANITEKREDNFKMAGIVSVVKQRSGSRGRFAFVYFSEVSGMFETSIFKDELITKNRENLISGKLLSILVSANKQENGSIRIVINDIIPLEDHLKLLQENGEEKKLAKPKFSYKDALKDNNFLAKEEKEVKFYEKEIFELAVTSLNLETIQLLQNTLQPLRLQDAKTSFIVKVNGYKILLGGKYKIPLDALSVISRIFAS